ncbi:MAG TPA: hypothetical protein VHI13_14435 [Candidatus Kapabacteria bacterium]|nr:hypothetical protein [Candidatus Kapabacteria bacterium]
MRRILLALLCALSCSTMLHATNPTGIAVVAKNGQVFVRWNNIIDTDIHYNVYRYTSPITTSNLGLATNLGWVPDSSAINRRYGSLLGTQKLLVTGTSLDPLAASHGLFVATSVGAGPYYYAVTTTKNGITDGVITTGCATTTSLTEAVLPPQPVLQETITQSGQTIKVYVHFGTRVSAGTYPVLTNVGSLPFTFGVNETGTGPHPVTVHLHPGGGSFLSAPKPEVANETRILLDDWLPNGEGSGWFGYNEHYDIYTHSNTVPTMDTNFAYTSERIWWTVDWVLATYTNLDTQRIYFTGDSRGAGGCIFNVMDFPWRVAAIDIQKGKYDLSFVNDPNIDIWNLGGSERLGADTMFGTVPSNLPVNIVNPNTGQYYGTFDRANVGYMAHVNRLNSLPLVFAINGKYDSLVGWAEKINVYDSLNANCHGGVYFWDNRTHGTTGKAWTTAEITPDLYRYRRDLSYPAFSNCSINNDPGNGVSANGDPIGTINGYLDWVDTSIVDQALKWEIDLAMNTALDGITVNGGGASLTINLPASCTVDITPRRLQKFLTAVTDSACVRWELWQGAVRQQTGRTVYHLGSLLTIPGVTVYKTGCTLKIRLVQCQPPGAPDPDLD